MRARTLSLATIWLTEKCLPMSRRKSRKLTGAVQAALSSRRAGLARGVEIEQAAELLLHLGDVGIQHLLGEQLALLRLAAGVADGAGGAAGQRDGVMAQQLEAAQRQQRHEVAHVQAVGGRVKAAVKRDGPGADALGQLLRIGAIGQQSAPLEFFQNVHGAVG